MGAFIPIKLDANIQTPNYAEELDALTRELETNSTLQLSQFCTSRKIPYQGFRGYLDSNGISIRQLRLKTGRKSADASVPEYHSELLAGITIKLPSQVEIAIPSILPSQLSNLLKLL